MASRRQRRRGDKRDRFTGEPSPELSAALAAIERAELAPIRLSEPDTITTNQGEHIDLRSPWTLPTTERRT